MTLALALLAYAAAMTVANLSIAEFGRWVVPLNAFFLIGLDLALRDWLHPRLRAWQMGALICVSGLLTYVLNPSAGHIAVASSVAFLLAASADWAVFVRLPGSWLRRANGSNIAGAAVDSIVFQLMAFGGLDPVTVAGMFIAKVGGGAVWAWLLSRRPATA